MISIIGSPAARFNALFFGLRAFLGTFGPGRAPGATRTVIEAHIAGSPLRWERSRRYSFDQARHEDSALTLSAVTLSSFESGFEQPLVRTSL